MNNDDAWVEIEKVLVNYVSKQGVTYTGKVKLTDNTDEHERVLEEMDFECTLVDENSYCRLGLMEMVNKDDLLLSVDHSSKTVLVSQEKHSKTSNQVFNIELFRKVLKEKDATVKVSKLENQKIVTIDNIADPSVQGYRIYYDPISYRIHKVEMGMVRFEPLSPDQETVNTNTEKDGSQTSATDVSSSELETYTYFLEVTFTDIKQLALNKKDFRPEAKFIQPDGNTISLTPAYQEYTLIKAGE